MPSSSGRGFQPNSLIALPASGFQPLVRNASCTFEANGLTPTIRAIASISSTPNMTIHIGRTSGT